MLYTQGRLLSMHNGKDRSASLVGLSSFSCIKNDWNHRLYTHAFTSIHYTYVYCTHLFPVMYVLFGNLTYLLKDIKALELEADT